MITLIRFLDHSRESEATKPIGCIGELYIDDEFVCYTVEQPYRDNRPFVSCVPVGEYFLVPYHSPKYGQVVALTNADTVVAYESEAKEGDRYACLFHSANWSSQLQGCIAVGENISWGTRKSEAGDYSANLMVTESRKTLRKILPLLVNQKITISWKY